jgi:hypothetical protein
MFCLVSSVHKGKDYQCSPLCRGLYHVNDVSATLLVQDCFLQEHKQGKCICNNTLLLQVFYINLNLITTSTFSIRNHYIVYLYPSLITGLLGY